MSRSVYQQCTLSPSGNSNDGVTPNPTVLYNGTVALAANMTTAPIEVREVDAYSISFATPAASTLVGTLSLQVSNDRAGNETQATPGVLLQNWQTLSFWDVGAGAQAVSKAVAAAAQTLLLAERSCTYRWVRLVFAFTSGTGNPTITLQKKGWA